MTAPQVASVLRDLGIRDEMNPHGFDLGKIGLRGDEVVGYRDPVRLRCGSGIAGRGGDWTLVDKATGESLSASVSTKKSLKKLLLEFMAGPRPPDVGDGRVWYARRNRTRFCDSVIWVPRRWSTT